MKVEYKGKSRFFTLAERRYSERRFSPRRVEDEVVQQLAGLVRVTPTALNLQPQRLLVIRSREAMEKLKACTAHSYGAPLAFLMCYDREVCSYHPLTWKPTGELDAAIALTHIMLAAEELGLGTLWVNGYDPARLREAFQLPERYVDVALLFAGWPREDSRPGPLHAKTKPLESLVTVL